MSTFTDIVEEVALEERRETLRRRRNSDFTGPPPPKLKIKRRRSDSIQYLSQATQNQQRITVKKYIFKK